QPIRSVFFPSFNPYQFAALLNELQPAHVSMINGSPPSVENAWRTDAIRKLNRVDVVERREEFTASTLDYRETLDVLAAIYGAHGDFEKLVLSPTGSKMQAVAVGLFRAFMHDVQIAYPTPLRYARPEQVTKGVGQKYELYLD